MKCWLISLTWLKCRKFPWKTSQLSHLIAHYSWPERHMRRKQREIKLLSRQFGSSPSLPGRKSRLVSFSENRAGPFELDYYSICVRGRKVYGEKMHQRTKGAAGQMTTLLARTMKRLPDFSKHTPAEFSISSPKLGCLLRTLQMSLLPSEGKVYKHLRFKKEE